MAKKGNNFGHQKSKKSWSEMTSSEQKRARTEYGQWKRSEEGRQGGTYHGVKPPAKGKKAATTVKKVATPVKKTVTRKPAPKKVITTKANYGPPSTSSPKKVTKTKADYGPPSTSSTTKTKDKVKPTGPGNYSTAGGVGKKSWSMLVDYKNEKGRGTKRQNFTRAPASMRELQAWWKGQQQSSRTPATKAGAFTRTQHPQNSSAMKRIAKRTWPKANWDWLK